MFGDKTTVKTKNKPLLLWPWRRTQLTSHLQNIFCSSLKKTTNGRNVARGYILISFFIADSNFYLHFDLHFLLFFLFLFKSKTDRDSNKKIKNRNMSYAQDDGWQLVRYMRRDRSYQQLPFLDPRVRGGRRYGGWSVLFLHLQWGSRFPSPYLTLTHFLTSNPWTNILVRWKLFWIHSLFLFSFHTFHFIYS